MGTALVALYAAAASVQEPGASSYDTYKSWLVACDNGLTCEAKGLANGGETGADLRFIRSAGPNGALTVRLNVATNTSINLDDLRVDDAPLRLDDSAWSEKFDDGIATLSTTRPAAVAAFVSRLRNGTKLQFGEDAGAYVPLDGMVAALLRIDDRQGRIGGTTALIRKGPALRRRSHPLRHCPSYRSGRSRRSCPIRKKNT
ncbi:hypothetical protein C7S15_4096 [Burkholderia cepacia]|nr:hypothetical protein [Burkholderia cepacia]